ncbi:MAG: HPr(Ser) kinase/phosphatase [Deltaproteobacteria bacterium]|nr:HPr(Ser) kinase/phosphatase [Deltaproteobacteria bacterium]
MEIRTLLSALRVELGLEILAGDKGLDRRVTAASIQKPGLALAGFSEMFKPGRIQVLGRTEIDYLWSLTPADRSQAVENLLGCTPPAVVVTRGADAPEQLVSSATTHGIPLLLTGLRSSIFVEALHKYLANRLARVRSIHGVLVDVFGVGVLMIGKSGIGKSECALELVMRGHRLAADDVIDVSKKPPSTIIGSGNELIRHHMEIRGLGIINIKDLFGISAIRETKRIDLVVSFEEWDTNRTYERLGVSDNTYEILGVSLPKVIIPVRPGRSLTAIVEVAARNQLLKVMGHHSAMEFQKRIQENLNLAKEWDGAGSLPNALLAEVTEEEIE